MSLDQHFLPLTPVVPHPEKLAGAVRSEEHVCLGSTAEASRPGRYFTETRWDLIELVRGAGHRVLEIGCGTGTTGEALKQRGKAVEVVGIECAAEAAGPAADRLDRVLTVDVEDETLSLPCAYFDYILAGDVLEHLRDPWAVVRRLGTSLKVGGFFLASLPNVRYWRVLRELVLRGRWEYAASGTLDRTHLRFFTRRSLASLFDPECFAVERIVPRFMLGPGSKSRLAHRLTLGLAEEFLTFQYLVVARRI
jgi:SAM-dependent methyltransferase